MQKKLILVLCVILGSLSFSCSEFILPKRVEVTGTVDLPVRVGVTDFSARFIEALQDAFSGGEADIRVYNVNYNKQTVQTFCIYLPIEMTENLNPNAFLGTINKQINNGISAEPRRIDPIQVPVPPGGQIPLGPISWPIINSVYLGDIAKYVVDIKFDQCDGTIESGIGINLYLEEIVDGLEMAIECDALNFSGEPKLLKRGNNIFGNSEELILALYGYQDNSKSVSFNMRLQSAGPNKNLLDVSAAGLTPGDTLTLMKGEVRFFRNWTEATIDMWAAIKAQKMEEHFAGTFPETTDEDGGFDLSGLGDYLDGGFTFDGLETKMYMNNPVSFQLHLELEPQYTGKEFVGALYDDEFSVDKEPFVLNDYLKDGNYTSKHLPGVDADHNDDSIDKDAVADIFDKKPRSLTFRYQIEFTERWLTVTPDIFRDDDRINEDDKSINITLMIMLPLRLTATTDGSVISFPDIFKKSGDLFGRDEDEIDENEKLFKSVKIKKIKMTVNFMDSIFSGGHLFIDGDRDNDPLLFYPDGIKLRGKRVIMDFTNSQMEIVRSSLIKPNLWIKLDKDDTITVPKNMGVMSVQFEMKGSIETEDILE